MYFSSKVAAIAVAVGSIASAMPADIENAINERQAVCNADNCLRAIRNTRLPTASAVSYCASYLSTAQSVSTVTAAPSIVHVGANPATVTISTSIATSTSSVDCTVTNTEPQLFKRAIQTPSYEAVITASCPALRNAVQSPAPARISSACSCALSAIGATTTTTTPLVTVTNAPAEVIFTSTTVTTVCTSTATVTVQGAPSPKPCSAVANPYRASTNTNKQFNVECGMFFYTGYGSLVTGSYSFQGCMDYCASQSDCIAVVTISSSTCLTYTLAQYQSVRNAGTGGPYPGFDRATLLGG